MGSENSGHSYTGQELEFVSFDERFHDTCTKEPGHVDPAAIDLAMKQIAAKIDQDIQDRLRKQLMYGTALQTIRSQRDMRSHFVIPIA